MTTSTEILEFNALSAVCRVIDKALDLDQALHDVLTVLSDTLSMKRATITLADRETGLLAISASHGLTPEERMRGVYRMDEGVTGTIFRTAKPFLIPDVRKEPLFLDKTGARKIEKDRITFIGVPIILHGEPIGVLNVDRVFDTAVSSGKDIEFLQVLATLIAQFISLNEQVKAKVLELETENVRLKSQLSREKGGPYIVGKSPAMAEVQRRIEKVASTRATVLLLGQSGTGKTLIARIIHELSTRKRNSFIKVNCASIPENLLEAELFGFEKGAFTGAVGQKAGKFEEADGGTIFLDEIGEVSLNVQSKLLRVLQEKEFERLGGNRTKRVDARIIAATNRNLSEMVKRNLFREDLYYRLNVFPIEVPSLAERREDIPTLLNHFIIRMNKEYGRVITMTPESMKLLTDYAWPGNVRELENLIERLVIMEDGEKIEPWKISTYLQADGLHEHDGIEAHGGSADKTLKEIERLEVVAALRRNRWVRSRAAGDLGLTLRQIGYRIMKFKLDEMIALERAKMRKHASGTD